MPFPLSRRGTVRLPFDPRLPVETAAAALEEALLGAEAAVVYRTGPRITFEAPMFGFPGRPTVPLAAITSGELEVVWRDGAHAVRYEIRFTGALIGFTLVMALVGLLVALVSGMPGFAVVGTLLGWAWLIGMNYLMASSRFPGYLSRLRILDPGGPMIRPAPRLDVDDPAPTPAPRSAAMRATPGDPSARTK